MADESADFFRRIDEKLTDVRDRVIRIEAQNHGSLIAALRADHEKLREDYSKELSDLRVEVERMKTKIAPIIAVVGMVGGALLTWAVKAFG